MYRRTGAGAKPLPTAMMAMAVLLQGYLGTSDAEAVELTVVDLRWQMVLDRLAEEEPAFSQAVLRDFRGRLSRTDMDRRLLERTVELARTTQEFDWKKLPQTLRVGMDSSPLGGAGRVEDTINLLGHAARKVVISQRQGRRARYRGVRRNLFDLRRAAALQNLEAIQRKIAARCVGSTRSAL